MFHTAAIQKTLFSFRIKKEQRQDYGLKEHDYK